MPDYSNPISPTSPKRGEGEIEAEAKAITSFYSPTSILSTLPGPPTHSGPTSILPPLFDADDNFHLTPSSYHIDMETFVHLLPDTIRGRNNSASDCHVDGSSCAIQGQSGHGDSGGANTTDPVGALFR